MYVHVSLDCNPVPHNLDAGCLLQTNSDPLAYPVDQE